MSEPSNGGDKGGETFTIEDLMHSLEASPDPIEEHRVASALREWGRSHEVTREAQFEDMAFSFHAHEHQDPSVWELYFGPMMSGTTESGERWDVPSLSDVSADTLDYWTRRALESRHPVLKARYADLCWELPKRLPDARPSYEMAKVAIDAYLAAVEQRRYQHSVTLVGKLKRALEISLQIADPGRLAIVRDALIALESDIAEDESLGLWGFAFDSLIEPPNRHIAVSDEQREQLVAALEARLDRFHKADATAFHPSGAEAAALRLAAYYKREGESKDVARVMGVYAAAVRKMQGVAAPMVLAHCLETLHEHLVQLGLRDDAKALTTEIREAGQQSLADMKEFSTSIEVPAEEVEAFFTELLHGTSEEVLVRFAVHFLPRQEELEAQLLQLSRDAPLSFLFSTAVKDDEGRTVARVGPIEGDLEGQLVRHTSQSLSLRIPWLREALRRGRSDGLVTFESVSEFVFGSPPFQSSRQPLMAAGLDAYFRDDTLAAVHILVPQIEQAIRYLTGLLQAPTLNARRDGGFRARVLDDLLREPALESVLGKDVVAYLRVLLTDERGWNVRNLVCHGLAAPNTFGAPVADRLLHAILLLSLVREGDPEADGENSDQATGDGVQDD